MTINCEVIGSRFDLQSPFQLLLQ
jgi:hypothetical protein